MSAESKMEQLQNSSSDILRRMRNMEEFCDVTLVSDDGKRVWAHKVVLASASSFFRDIFQVDEEMEEYQVIDMKGVKSRLLRAMIDLVYNGETQVEQRECEEFLNIMSHYKVLKDIPRKKRSNFKCKFFNRGFCQVGLDCLFDHPMDDCETHMKGGHCKNKECPKRHRHIWKHWDSKSGCFRKSHCSYLHKDPKQI